LEEVEENFSKESLSDSQIKQDENKEITISINKERIPPKE